METIRYGFSNFWKKYFKIAIVIQICSFLAILADLLLPLLSALFIDYIIKADTRPAKGIFAFLINGNYGEQEVLNCFLI